ncbi:Pectic acid lyase [Caulifigura coniformis]|uniref:Pectic acid lyase n=1 Tax=Caulifigura coniformis TaxID=2527983 RepID=A0A517SJU9_9PLAN|nr:pectate lyase [Caulifigura coniformis]QDT56397.1 Pectic acid lyase [Caulifigura coniformis]
MSAIRLWSMLGSLLTAVAVFTSPLNGGDPLATQARDAVSRAGAFYHEKVAAHGGYVYQYSADLSLREGESVTDLETVWVQPPGTPTVGLTFLKAYERTGDERLLVAAKDAAYCLLEGQFQSGAWNGWIDFAPDKRKNYAFITGKNQKKNARNYSTFDDDKTQAALKFLMRYDRSTGFKDARVHAAVERALSSVLTAQFAHGGWPQGYKAPVDQTVTKVARARYPADWPRQYPGGDYWDFPTLNDNSQVDVIETLFQASEIYGQPAYRSAALKGAGFLLAAQMPEPQPAWAQQYNYDFEPVWARKFEPPAVSGSESQNVIAMLMDVYVETGDRTFLAAIEPALNYLERSKLSDGQLARFYELKTNEPLYFTREYVLTKDDSDLPTHYGFKVSSKLESLRKRFEKLSTAKPAALEQEKARLWGRSERTSPPSADEVQRVIASLDHRGAWVETGRLKYHPGKKEDRPIISSATFARNMDLLSRYIAAHSTK